MIPSDRHIACSQDFKDLNEARWEALLERLIDLQIESMELQKRQLAQQREARSLLHRILLGDDAQLTTADVTAALNIGRSKLYELLDEGELSMYHLPCANGGRGERRMNRRLFRAVLRRWQQRDA